MKKVFSARPVINVTPMIDILLVLLILFMVIAPSAPRRYAAKAPTPPEDTARTDATALMIILGSDGSLRLNQLSFSGLSELEPALRQALEGRPADRCEVFVRAPRGLRYGDVIRVIDIVKRVGGNPIGMVLDQLDS